MTPASDLFPVKLWLKQEKWLINTLTKWAIGSPHLSLSFIILSSSGSSLQAEDKTWKLIQSIEQEKKWFMLTGQNWENHPNVKSFDQLWLQKAFSLKQMANYDLKHYRSDKIKFSEQQWKRREIEKKSSTIRFKRNIYRQKTIIKVFQAVTRHLNQEAMVLSWSNITFFLPVSRKWFVLLKF